MADIDTGKVEDVACTLDHIERYAEARVMRELLADRDRLSRELAEAKDAHRVELGRLAYQRQANEELRQQLAESERLGAARNKRNGELAMENERLRGALEHITEYWNGNLNERAMRDALDHIEATAHAALTAPASGGAT